MRRLAATLFALALSLAAHAAQAGVLVTVNKTTQELTVEVDGTMQYRWPVSTARWGYNTPNGTYRPQRLERQWYSRKYDWSPMPYSIFFAGGYAIHGSNEISRLGRPASHGCIRLHPKNAAVLFDLVKRNPGAVRIDIIGSRPGAAPESRQQRGARTVEFRPRKRVIVEEPIMRRRVAPQHETFEEIFIEPPRARSRRAAQWDDF
ncbi:MAG TPA: L,D-transpeptidase [Pseudolabrys sp.]|nr:L,D-transpeptidase [Pseudolabrys sp.]